MKSIHFRKLLPWLVVAAVMGTGTLNAHFKAAASPKASPASALETKARESQTA
jgi:hypothetical protein